MKMILQKFPQQYFYKQTSIPKNNISPYNFETELQKTPANASIGLYNLPYTQKDIRQIHKLPVQNHTSIKRFTTNNRIQPVKPDYTIKIKPVK